MIAAIVAVALLAAGPAHSDRAGFWHESPLLRAWHQACWSPPGPKVVAAYASYARDREPYMRGEIRPILQSVTNIMEREGPHTIRWSCNHRGKPRVRLVRLRRSGYGPDYDITASMQAAGYDLDDRVYVVFTPGYTRWCGSADIGPSDEALYAHVECWSPRVTLHELLHTFGAVPDEAPDQAHNNHCDSLRDIMCNEYGSRELCPRRPWSHIDCGRDDYYMHEGDWWDVEDSPFLRRHP